MKLTMTVCVNLISSVMRFDKFSMLVLSADKRSIGSEKSVARESANAALGMWKRDVISSTDVTPELPEIQCDDSHAFSSVSCASVARMISPDSSLL